MIMKIKCLYSLLLNNKNILKRICCLMIAMLQLVLVLMLTGCGEKSDNISEIKIGVCIHNDTEIFVSSIVKNMREWCQKKEQETGVYYTLDVVSAKDSQLTQNDQVEEFINKEYDVLCVNLVDRSDATLIIDMAIKSNTPIVFFNRELVKEDLDRWDKLYYVGGATRQAGRMQAEIIIDALSDKKTFDKYDVNGNGVIQYVVLEGETNHQDAIIRTLVVTEELKNAGFSIEKLGDEYANWERDQAKTKMKELIQRYPFQIEMVVANSDEMALGTIEALKDANYPIEPFIVGVDGNEDALEAIRTGKLNGSVFNDAKGQAKAIMELSNSLATNSPVPEDIVLNFDKYVYLPYEPITYDNVQDYIN